MPTLHPADVWQQTGRYDAIGAGDVPPEGPGRPGHGAGHDPRGGLHLAGRPGAALLPRPAPDLVPAPAQVPRRAAAQGRRPARARVPHEGLLLVRPRRGGPGGELRQAHRRLRPHLRALRAGVLPGGERQRASWAALRRTSTWRRRPPARTGWPCATPAAMRPTWSWPARWRCAPEDRGRRGRCAERPRRARGVRRPTQRTIEEVSAFLDIAGVSLIKSLSIWPATKPVLALVRGDHEPAREQAGAIPEGARSGRRIPRRCWRSPGWRWASSGRWACEGGCASIADETPGPAGPERARARTRRAPTRRTPTCGA